METGKSVEEIRREYYDMTSKLPEWIIGRYELHHQVWNLIDEANTIISILLTDRVLRDKSIIRIIERFDAVIDLISRTGISNQIQIKMAIYWLDLVNNMRTRCLEEQQYECCSNLKKFSDLYLIPLPENDNE
jgi:hypothetical protein